MQTRVHWNSYPLLMRIVYNLLILINNVHISTLKWQFYQHLCCLALHLSFNLTFRILCTEANWSNESTSSLVIWECWIRLTGCLHHGPRSCPLLPYNIWLDVNSSCDHFGLHQGGKKCKSDHGTGGPQNACFKACTIQCRGPMGFAVRETKEVLSL